MKEKTFTKTLLYSLLCFVLLQFSSCDKVDADDYLSKLVGTWTTIAEWEDGVAVAEADLAPMTLTFTEEMTWFLVIRNNEGTVVYTSENDGTFELYRGMILGTVDAGEIELIRSILSISDTQLLIQNDGAGLYVIKTLLEKEIDETQR